jgi:hypothetical protein
LLDAKNACVLAIASACPQARRTAGVCYEAEADNRLIPTDMTQWRGIAVAINALFSLAA